MSSSNMITSTIGFPRIGPNREMKKALERFASAAVPGPSSPRCISSILAVDLCRAYNMECCCLQLLEEAVEFGRPLEG